MDEQKPDGQLESIYNSSLPIQDIALKTSRERWMIEMGGERESGRSVQAARYDDDVENPYICILIYMIENYFKKSLKYQCSCYL